MKKLWQNYVIERTCKNCGVKFLAYRHNVAKGYGIYCSRACRNSGAGLGWKKGHGRLYSDEVLERKRPKISGENHWNWQGGITPLIRKIRNSLEYKKWVRAVHEKNSLICVLCGSKKRIEADHNPKRFIDIFKENKIKTFKEALHCKEMWDTKNGRTLCYWCHKIATYA